MPTPERDVLQGLGALRRLLGYVLGLPAAPAAGATRRERALALQEASVGVLARAGLAVEVRGEPPRGPAVLVSNHLSWFDPLVVATLVPLTAVAKDDVAAWPVIGARARGLGVVFVDRLDAHDGVRALLEARRSLEAGVSVLNFPEGTTTHGDMVLPFRRGIFGLARLAGVPVVPVRLEVDRGLTWAGPDPLFPHLWRLCATRGPKVRLHFLEPLARGAWPDAVAAEHARRLILRPPSLKTPLRRGHVAAALSA